MWPVELSLVTGEQMPYGDIYATGNERNNGRWSYVLDGIGNATFPMVSGDIGYTGVIVRFSDQSFQIDNGLVQIDSIANKE